MGGFIGNGLKEALASAKIAKEKVGKGYLLTYLLEICWCFILYGARPRDYVMFGFYYQNHRRRNQCFTTFRFFKIKKELEKLTSNYNIHNNKENQLRLFAEHIKRNWLCVDSDTADDNITKFISDNSKVIVKPNGGTYGKGIFMIYGEKDENVNLLFSKKNERLILEEVVENIEELAKFNRSSLNTFRVYTFLDKNHKCEILGIMLRIGTMGSEVDNWGAGGVGYNFDVETGICDQPGRDKNMNQYIFHPGTDYQMVGYKLPMFSELKKYVLELVKVIPEARYVGWDIALTPKGFDLIEINCPGGNDFLQAFGKYYNDYIKVNW